VKRWRGYPEKEKRSRRLQSTFWYLKGERVFSKVRINTYSQEEEEEKIDHADFIKAS